MAPTASRSTTGVLILFQDAQDAQVLCAALARKLLEAGFSVNDSQTSTTTTVRRCFLVVQASRKILEQEAEMSGMLKALSDGNASRFSVAKGATFKGYNADGENFFTEAEEALLLLQAIRGRVNNFGMFSERLETMVPLRSSAGPAIWRSSSWLDWSELGTNSKLTSAIVGYFGYGLGFYFEWLNHFTAWLSVPAMFGACLAVGRYVRGIELDEDWSLPIYSVFIMLWSVVFIRCWERRTSYLCHEWKLYSDWTPRYAKPVVRSYMSRLGSYAASILVTSVGLLIAFSVMICSLNLQGYIKDREWTERPFYIPFLARFSEEGNIFGPQAGFIMSLVPPVLHSSVILLLNSLYREVAEVLTNWENHNTEEDHHYSMVLKRFLFEAFDCYIALFYLAFAQFNIPALRAELISLYSTDQVRRVLLETILPACMNYGVHKLRIRESGKNKRMNDDPRSTKSTSEVDFALMDVDMPDYESFDDYLEMVIEFGYITLFASAFPLCPLVSLLSNIIESKSDLFKVCFVYRRADPKSEHGIGAWLDVLRAIAATSVVTNCFLVGFSSEQIVSYLPGFFTTKATHVEEHDAVLVEGKGRYLVAICFMIEHLLGLLCLILYFSIPSESEHVKRERGRLQLRQKRRERNALSELDDFFATAAAESGTSSGSSENRNKMKCPNCGSLQTENYASGQYIYYKCKSCKGQWRRRLVNGNVVNNSDSEGE